MHPPAPVIFLKYSDVFTRIFLRKKTGFQAAQTIILPKHVINTNADVKILCLLCRKILFGEFEYTLQTTSQCGRTFTRTGCEKLTDQVFNDENS
ncbi:hypothetical protein ATG66_3271 [Vibrio sp. ES.051]|nr:hypothetical protein ATG66_3271 [Vibrio sp. ES.051]